jgi:hypothetical protein
MIAALSAAGHDWFDWSILIVGTIAAATGLFVAYALRWERPHCEIRSPRIRVVAPPRAEVWIDILILPGSSSWKLARFDATFASDGNTLDYFERNVPPIGSADAYTGPLKYEIDMPTADLEVVLRYKFHHGGRTKTFRSTLSTRE